MLSKNGDHKRAAGTIFGLCEYHLNGFNLDKPSLEPGRAVIAIAIAIAHIVVGVNHDIVFIACIYLHLP